MFHLTFLYELLGNLALAASYFLRPAMAVLRASADGGLYDHPGSSLSDLLGCIPGRSLGCIYAVVAGSR